MMFEQDNRHMSYSDITIPIHIHKITDTEMVNELW